MWSKCSEFDPSKTLTLKEHVSCLLIINLFKYNPGTFTAIDAKSASK